MITKTQMSRARTYTDNWDNCVNLKGSYGNIISEMKKKILPKEKFSAIQSIKLLYYIVVHDKLLTLLIFDIPGLTQDLCLCGTLLACLWHNIIISILFAILTQNSIVGPRKLLMTTSLLSFLEETSGS